MDEDGIYEPHRRRHLRRLQAAGQSGPNGRLTGAAARRPRRRARRGPGARHSDTNTLWAATSTGRVFISKNADDASPAAVLFARLDSPPRTIRRATRRRSSWTARPEPRLDHLQRLQRQDPADAGAHLRDRLRPRRPAPRRSRTRRDRGTRLRRHPGELDHRDRARRHLRRQRLRRRGEETGQRRMEAGAPGLPAVNVPDLVYVPEQGVLFAGTHGQGIWQLKVK